MSERDYTDFIQDIIDAINSINVFIANMSFEEFIKDDKTFSAVTRKFEIIGEAANRIPKQIQQKYNDIPWPYMIGMRNKIIHDYDGVNLMIVFDSAKEDLNDLLPLLEKILK
ncbi:MAG: DUF86 domain-containing protein [Candidatus Gastranaerophilales bacterium]|nr:DUF86 domain-containing protein [Candidatus Gastranaerophilales bacterium]